MFLSLAPWAWEIQAPLGKAVQLRILPYHLHWNVSYLPIFVVSHMEQFCVYDGCLPLISFHFCRVHLYHEKMLPNVL